MGSKTVRLLVVVGLLGGLVSCGGGETSRERNARSLAGAVCRNPGATKKLGSQRFACGATPIGGVWYETTKAKGKTVACKKPGKIRYKTRVLWVCATTPRLTSWYATKPLSTAMSVSPATTPGASTEPTTSDSGSSASPTGPTTTLPAGGFTTALDAPAQPNTAELNEPQADPLPTERAGDFDGPSILSVEVSQDVVSPGDLFEVRIEATDPSGIDSVGMTFEVDEVQRDFCGQQMIRVEGDEFRGTWVAQCKGPAIGTNGDYLVRPIATDNAGNFTNTNCCTLSPLRGRFTLDGAINDEDGPNLKTIEVSRVNVVPGDTFTIDVTAEDRSGIRYMGFTFELGTQQLDFCGYTMQRVSGTSTNGRWTVSCTVPTTARNGKYVITPYAADFVDNFTNTNCCTRSNLRGEFTVSEGSDDADGPAIESVVITPEVVNVGDELTITIKARDVTGIQYVGFTFSVDDAQRDICGQSLTRESGTAKSSTWTTRCTIPVTAQPGTYVVTPYAADVIGNYTNTNCCSRSAIRGRFTLN